MTESLNDAFAGKLARLEAPSRDVSELAELKDFVKRIDRVEVSDLIVLRHCRIIIDIVFQIQQMLKDIDLLKAHIGVLDEFSTPLPKYDFDLFWKVRTTI